MKKLWLHIGPHKTGTTSLQYFFLKNSQNLLDNDIYYPADGVYFRRYSQRELAQFLCNDEYTLPTNLNNNELNKEKCISDIQRDIIQSNCSQILVSSEHFSHADTLEKVLEIKKCFEPVVSDIQIIYYLRRQDQRIMSAYNQVTKLGDNNLPFDKYVLKSIENNTLDYYLKLSLFAEVFGKENIHVQIFKSKDIISSFMKILNINDYSMMEIPSKQNESLPVELVELFRCTSAQFSDRKIKQKLKNLILNTTIKGLDTGKYTLLTSDLREQILNHYQHSNMLVTSEFLTQENAELFLEYEDIELPLYPGITPEKIGFIVSQIILNDKLKQKYDHLKQKNGQLKQKYDHLKQKTNFSLKLLNTLSSSFKGIFKLFK